MYVDLACVSQRQVADLAGSLGSDLTRLGMGGAFQVGNSGFPGIAIPRPCPTAVYGRIP